MPIILGGGVVRTPRDLIVLAFKDSGIYGVAQTPLAEDTNDAFMRVNMMLAQWNRKRWLIYQLVDTAFVSTGAQSYSVAVGGDFNVARPDRIEAAYFRQLNVGTPVDFPLEQLQSMEDYSRVALKSLTAFSKYFFYNPSMPEGRFYPWPIPQASQYELHILTKQVISQFSSLSQTINLPDEYLAAIFYNLCQRLRPAYGKQPDPTITAMAKDALNVIRGTATAIPRLRMPSGLTRGNGYDIYGDGN